MEACGDYYQFLKAMRPRSLTRALHESSLLLSELAGPSGFGPTEAIAYDNAYVVQLRLQDCPRCSYFLGGEPLQVDDRSAGALQIHDLRLAPSAVITDPFHVIHLYLPRTMLSSIAEDTHGGSFNNLRFTHGESYRDETISGLLLALRPLLERPREASALLIDHITQSLCVQIIDRFGSLATRRLRTRGGLAAWQAKHVRDVIESHLAEDITLSGLAAECGLSVRHFSRAFAQSFGMPAHRYVVTRRVQLALELLKIRSLSIPEIALKCGFVDQSHLTRVFASQIGRSPGNWRRMQCCA
jgi:AraC family transcriptional regulator